MMKFRLLLSSSLSMVALTLVWLSVTTPLSAQSSKKPATLTEASKKNSAAKLEEIMQIIYLNDGLKSPFDEIQVSNTQALVKVWRDLPTQPSTERVECLGYRWLLAGRGKRMGFGVGRVFEEFPQLQTLELQLFELDFEVESVDGRGKLKKKTLPKRYLRYRIGREQALRVSGKTDRLKEELGASLGRCLTIGRRVKIDKEIVL